jgi:hypothetical protein
MDSHVCYHYNTLVKEQSMFENPVAKRTAIAAAIGAVIAIPLPFVGPILGALVGGGIGYFTADRQRHA